MKNMKKVLIKVIKRNNKNTAKKICVVAPVNAAKIETDIQIEMVKTVGNWISERRENGRAEQIFSDGKISAWKTVSEKLVETII
jgi:vacuolar-type H+-ATPase subunit H